MHAVYWFYASRTMETISSDCVPVSIPNIFAFRLHSLLIGLCKSVILLLSSRCVLFLIEYLKKMPENSEDRPNVMSKFTSVRALRNIRPNYQSVSLTGLICMVLKKNAKVLSRCCNSNKV